MNFYQELKKYLNNNLFTSYTLEIEFPNIYNFKENEKIYKNNLDKIIKLYDIEKFKEQNEHQFEDDFISKVLEILGWKFVRQDIKIIQGKEEKPDFLLFYDEKSKIKYEKLNKEIKKSNNDFSIIVESKAYECRNR